MKTIENLFEEAISDNNKAVISAHYANVACDMNKITGLAEKYGLYVIEDAVQGMISKCRSDFWGLLVSWAAKASMKPIIPSVVVEWSF